MAEVLLCTLFGPVFLSVAVCSTKRIIRIQSSEAVLISSPQTPSEESFVLGLFAPARSLSQGETSSADVSVNYLLVHVGGRGAAGAEGSRCSERRQCLPLCSRSTQPAQCSATWRRISEFLEVVYGP